MGRPLLMCIVGLVACGPAQVERGAADSVAIQYVTDVRDGHRYPTVQLGKRLWMARNLNHASSDSWCYGDVEANCEVFGRLYTWAAAKEACPVGWHLPTEADWSELAEAYGGYFDLPQRDSVGDPRQAYRLLLEGGASGFGAMLGGSRTLASGESVDVREDGMYWSSSTCGGDGVHFMVFNQGHSRLIRDCWTAHFASSVRCVQDASGAVLDGATEEPRGP